MDNNNNPTPDTTKVEPNKVVHTITENPFSYNYIALNKSKVDEIPVPGMESIKSDTLYYRLGKSLGIEDAHDWPKYYQKVFTIAEWAKERVGSSDPDIILNWVGKALKYLPSMGSKRINDMYNHIRISIEKGKNEHTT